VISGCAPSAAPDVVSDSGMDSMVVTDAYPTSCDASMPGRSCYDSCLYEGANLPQSCVVFCSPIPSGGMFGPCTTNDPDYLCRLTTAPADGGVYVECLPLA
jgi:hypothetical protein